MESTFDTPGGVDLHVQVGAGHVKVESDDRATTEVHLIALNRAAEDAIAEMTVRCDERGGRAEIHIEEPKKSGLGLVSSLFNNAEIGVHVRCPRQTALDVKTGSAELEVKGEIESAHARTGSGDIGFDDVVDDLDVTSASGDVSVGDVNGHCRVKTASGDVRVASVGGELYANLVSGDIRVGEVRGAVTVQTVSGDQHIGAVSSGEIKLQAVSGDVHVGVRPGLRLWIDATSVSGDMSSELDSADGPPAGDGPLVQLRARTVSGDVNIVRAA